MARNHVIHGFKFNGVDLKAGRFSINKSNEFTVSIFPDPTESSLSLGDQTLPKAEFALDEVVLPPLEKHRLVFGVPRYGKGGKEVKAQAAT